MKASYLAVAVVLASVAGAVALTGVPDGSKPSKPRTVASKVAAQPAPEAPPFPALEGPIWDLPNVDARLRIPVGWEIGKVGGDVRLLRNAADQLDGNINLLLLPNVYGLSTEELLQENIDELAINPDLHLEDRRELYVMGRKILRFDYNGTPRNGSEPVRFVAIVWTRGKYQVALTTTVRANLWPQVAGEVDAALESLQIRWPVARTK